MAVASRPRQCATARRARATSRRRRAHPFCIHRRSEADALGCAGHDCRVRGVAHAARELHPTRRGRTRPGSARCAGGCARRRGRRDARAPLGVGLARWIRPRAALGGCLARLLCARTALRPRRDRGSRRARRQPRRTRTVRPREGGPGPSGNTQPIGTASPASGLRQLRSAPVSSALADPAGTVPIDPPSSGEAPRGRRGRARHRVARHVPPCTRVPSASRHSAKRGNGLGIGPGAAPHSPPGARAAHPAIGGGRDLRHRRCCTPRAGGVHHRRRPVDDAGDGDRGPRRLRPVPRVDIAGRRGASSAQLAGDRAVGERGLRASGDRCRVHGSRGSVRVGSGGARIGDVLEPLHLHHRAVSRGTPVGQHRGVVRGAPLHREAVPACARRHSLAPLPAVPQRARLGPNRSRDRAHRSAVARAPHGARRAVMVVRCRRRTPVRCGDGVSALDRPGAPTPVAGVVRHSSSRRPPARHRADPCNRAVPPACLRPGRPRNAHRALRRSRSPGRRGNRVWAATRDRVRCRGHRTGGASFS